MKKLNLQHAVYAVAIAGFVWGLDGLISIVLRGSVSVSSCISLLALFTPLLILKPQPWKFLMGASLCLIEVLISGFIFLHLFLSAMDPLVFRVHFMGLEVFELTGGFAQLVYCFTRAIVFLFSAAILLQAVAPIQHEPFVSRGFATFLSSLVPGSGQAFQGRYLMVATLLITAVIDLVLIPVLPLVNIWAAIDAYRSHSRRWPIQPLEPTGADASVARL